MQPTDIGMIFHQDMILGKDDYDYHAFKHWKHGNVVCSTRIEPPLHPEGPEKIVENFGIKVEQDVEEGFDEKGFDEYVENVKNNMEKKLLKVVSSLVNSQKRFRENWWTRLSF